MSCSIWQFKKAVWRLYWLSDNLFSPVIFLLRACIDLFGLGGAMGSECYSSFDLLNVMFSSACLSVCLPVTKIEQHYTTDDNTIWIQCGSGNNTLHFCVDPFFHFRLCNTSSWILMKKNQACSGDWYSPVFDICCRFFVLTSSLDLLFQ